MISRRISFGLYAFALVLVASAVSGQAPAPGGPLTVLSREGRRGLSTTDAQGHQMVGLDDLSSLFQLTIREDAAARAVTVSYKTNTIVLTPDQSLASMSGGRLISLPAPLTRQGRRPSTSSGRPEPAEGRWLVPVEFISRALAPIYDTRIDFRPASRLVILGDLRVPRVAVQYDDSNNSLKVTFDTTPKTTTAVVQDQNRLLVRFEADALDTQLPPAPSQQGLLTAIRGVDPATLLMELGPRFASYRASTPTSSGASAVLVIELLSSAAPPPANAAPQETLATPPLALPLPVFGGGPRSAIQTIVLDPGHGGPDNGVKGPGGTLEKDVTMAVARRVKGVIEGRLGIRVLLTHDDDTSIDADGRAAMANNNKADLFISLHANGSPLAGTKGASIFSLSLDRFGEDARRQSQVDREVLPVYGGGTRDFSLVEWELAQAAHIEGSTALAGLVEQRLRESPGIASVILQKAPMRTLAGANMPAVLVEMGYLSNPDEEKTLGSAEFRNAIAQALTEAVVAFRDYLEHGAAVPAP